MKRILPIILLAVAALAFGCGKSDTVQSSDGKLKVEQQGDTAKFEVVTKEGKTTMTASDKGVAIPETFPKDVPIPKGAVARLTMSQGKTEILHLQVPGSIVAVARDYQELLKGQGWEIASSMNMGEASMVQAKKGSRQCAAMVMKDDAGTVIQLSVASE